MKKLCAVLAAAVLIFLLASCDLSSLFKGGQAATNNATNEEVNQPTENPSVEGTQQPQGTTTTKRPSTTQGTTPGTTQGTTTTQPITPPPPVKQEKAGLGIIFVTNLRTGVFRVKANKETLIDHSFQRPGGLGSKEIRMERELKVPAGQLDLKFVVEDNAGSRGVRNMTVVYPAKSHHVIKVVAEGAPGDMVVQVLQ